MRPKLNSWLFAFLLLLPMLAFFAGYLFNHNRDFLPTGLIMEDNALYLSYARQYLDANQLNLFYSNPFNESSAYPNIYLQVQNFILALMLKTGLGGFSMILFVLIFSLLCFRLVIAIYDSLVPSAKYRTISIILFAWGGGLLALSGIPVHFFRPPDGQDFFDRIFFLDPGWGWWGLNLGRSLFITCEAFYHFLFLWSIYLIIRKRWTAALLVIFILSISHPFTGVELLGILSAWVGVEKIFAKNKEMPWYFFTGIMILLAFHVFYYLWYLVQFPDHKSVSEQFSVNWQLRFFSMIPAYAIVVPLAFLAIFKFSKPRRYFADPLKRLFLCWLIIVLLLVNHELFMKPRQPIHFTRGYDWTAFFLLGLPALIPLFDYFKKIKWGKTLYIIFISLFLSDNFLWIVNYIRFTDKTKAVMYISPEQKEILQHVKANSDNNTLLVSSDVDLTMLATVYTPVYPWISNRYTTPFYENKKARFDNFINTGIPDSAWAERKIIYVFDLRDSVQRNLSNQFTHGTLLKRLPSYSLYFDR